ncbi:MAG: GMC family oxidoreductase N-terminal domain-containing protein, partial [Sphingomonadales bacterium]|nr:GMC family oxidoreductase N-terminal domain-containing protein [Sphingomonadales bacterium]
RFMWSAGKMLGGSSSINGLVYIRGTRADHQRWVDAGCSGWSFDECLPFFLRSEGYAGEPSQFHGTHGPLGVEPMADPHPLSPRFVEACAQAGIPALEEYCDGKADGAFLSLTTQRRSKRSSTAAAFLKEAARRPNLRIVTGATVERIRFDGTRAVAVEARVHGELRTFAFDREVIVSAGAIGTPALLMRSGIGPAEQLRGWGLPVVADRRDVGRNLQEHPTVSINKFVSVDTYNSRMRPWQIAGSLLAYLLRGKGPMATPAVQAMALARTRLDLAEPDVQLHFYPVGYDLGPELLSAAAAKMPREPVITIGASVGNPYSRGQVLLAGPDPRDLPAIRHELIGDPRDVQTLIAACKLIERIYDAPALAQFVLGDRNPAPIPQDDAGWDVHVRRNTSLSYHPVGTCRMGGDAEAVVSPRLQLNGVQGMRIADASVIPLLPRANTNATAIMVGERVADFISRGSAAA